MSIYYEKSRKRYTAAVMVNGRRIVKRFKTRSEADEWHAGIKNSVYSGTFVAPSSITLGDWVTEYLTVYSAGKVRPRTITRYAQTALHLAPIRDIPLQKINALTVQKFYHTVKSDAEKRKIHVLLSSIFKKAVALDLVKKNIMAAVEAPRYSPKEVTVFTMKELGTLMKSVKNSRYYSRYYPLIYLAVTTGARLSEILALKSEHVHHGYILIVENVQFHKGKMLTQPPKTKAGRRKITISETLYDLLPRTEYVFPTAGGKPIQATNFEKAWKKMLEEANLPYKNFHCLRHTHATQLLAAGIPILEVSKRLGHAKASHTLELYGHAIPDYDKQIPDTIEKLFPTC